MRGNQIVATWHDASASNDQASSINWNMYDNTTLLGMGNEPQQHYGSGGAYASISGDSTYWDTTGVVNVWVHNPTSEYVALTLTGTGSAPPQEQHAVSPGSTHLVAVPRGGDIRVDSLTLYQ
jgi:hypothetical protein